MNSLMLGIGSALWLGLLTSISPCPLATNLAAISYVGREAGKSWGVWSSGRMYTLERVLAYTLLGALVVASVLSAPGFRRGSRGTSTCSSAPRWSSWGWSS